MSAPVSHHPLVVNTADGSCWTRRAVTADGRGLYALAGSVAGVPDEVLVSLADLAELGITGSAFALPMPVGPVMRSELDQARDDVVGACLARWEEEQDNARLRLALASAKRGRSQLRELVRQMCDALNGHDCPPPGEKPMETVTRAAVWLMEAEARIAELESERHTTNEALDDAVQALRADRAEPAEGPSAAESADRLTAFFAPVASLREDPVAEPVSPRVQATRALLDGQRAAVEDPHDGPLHHSDRVGRDLPETGGA